jgi:predicted phosphate transport protein (TIGR00153 family)
MRFSLIPREMRFYDMFDEAAALLHAASDRFLDMLTHFDNISERGQKIKEDEETCDDIVGRIIKALDRSFIAPFDREDIHTLATKLDNIMDRIEQTAHRFVVFRIDRPTPEAVDLARIIRDCCVKLELAIRQCREMRRSNNIKEHLLEISRLENEADRIYRKEDATLFAKDSTDILNLIKWRELYTWLEETVDACKDASQVVSEIVIKGS